MCWKEKKLVISVKKEKEEEEQQWMPELPDEVWFDIMRKLPIKPLHVCKCVCKTWLSYVSHILYYVNKGLDLPPLGILFRRSAKSISDPKNKLDELCYVSCDDYSLSRWTSFVDDPEPKTAIVRLTQTQTHTYDKGISEGLLSSLSIDFGGLIMNSKRFGFWTMHRGLALVSSRDNHDLLVYNPATTEKFVLPTPFRTSPPTEIVPANIILNLSDHLLSAQCNFKVIRFSRYRVEGTRTIRCFAEVYYSNNNQWCQSEVICSNNFILATSWILSSAVLFEDTLVFFIKGRKRAVGIKFLWGKGEVSAFSVPLHRRVRKRGIVSTLHVSQGCLYLTYDRPGRLWIWKHDNEKSLDAQEAWIPHLIFEDSPGKNLCQPVAESFLSLMLGRELELVSVIAFHHDAPVVFIHIEPFIYAFDLLNDTVERIVELGLTQRSCIAPGYVHMYSPCFASFQCLKRQNHQPT